MNWNEDDFQSGEKWCRAELLTASGQPVFSVSLYFSQLECETRVNLLHYNDFFFFNVFCVFLQSFTPLKIFILTN